MDSEQGDATSLITSTRNPLIKRVRALSRRDARDAEDVIIIEGLRAIIAAVRAGVRVETMLYAPERLRSAVAQAALDDAQAQGAQVTPASAKVLDALSERDASQGVIAIARRPQATIAAIPTTGAPLVIALFEPQDPGNVGAIARTADGAGAAALVTFGARGVDPFDPKAIRSSMGALFALPVIELGATVPALAALRSRGLRLVGTSDKGTTVLWSEPLTGPVALLMGNERAGLDAPALAACDAVTRIPLAGQSDSLNVAAAAAIFLFEAVRQRSG